jgi:hypothetical protein
MSILEIEVVKQSLFGFHALHDEDQHCRKTADIFEPSLQSMEATVIACMMLLDTGTTIKAGLRKRWIAEARPLFG